MAHANPNLSPRWVRLIVWAALLLLALGAIRIIDRHVMARQERLLQSATP